ncbi:RING-box protein 2 [Eurytemora carolleeae]|uniref:RING-box protein 2 n=1 Tax=Eurytemora carolleeae TaxID=1294199 RepID=UPI000C76B339|nr:RING-box protein 2 [Eurytemora carolleeae]|eukprot:XP_023336445.1 RING-box protein 2-like [Eurytemora affinis]
MMEELEKVEDGGIEKKNEEEVKEEGGGRMFTMKKWNAVAMWSWDVECDTCAICRVQVMDACLRCQSETKVRLFGWYMCIGYTHVCY